MALDLAAGQEAIRITGLIYTACYTAITYDWVTCLPREVESVWKAKWGPPKVAFLALRYIGLVYNVFPLLAVTTSVFADMKTCQRVIYLEVIGFNLIMWISQLIFLMRTSAIWERNRLIVFTLLTVLLAEIGIHIYGVTLSKATFIPPGFVHPQICIYAFHETKLWISTVTFAMPLLFDTLVCVCTFIKLLPQLRTSMTGKDRQSQVIQLLLRDGFLCFFLVTAVAGINMTFFITVNPLRKHLILPVLNVTTQILTSRLYLNLKDLNSPYTRSTIDSARISDHRKVLPFQLYKLDEVVPSPNDKYVFNGSESLTELRPTE